jgi:hypothetical protein
MWQCRKFQMSLHDASPPPAGLWVVSHLRSAIGRAPYCWGDPADRVCGMKRSKSPMPVEALAVPARGSYHRRMEGTIRSWARCRAMTVHIEDPPRRAMWPWALFWPPLWLVVLIMSRPTCLLCLERDDAY